jgi:hypothetical protein
MLFFTHDFSVAKGATYTAFEINSIVSMLFIYMLLSRNTVKGQSIYIAIAKMIGTACASLAVYQSLPSSILLNFLYLAILLFDGVYTVMLYGKFREQGMIPWQRV